MPFATAFLLGLCGGLHCAGMCGPLMLAMPVTSRNPISFFLHRLTYQLGRIATYCLLGVLFGLLGKTLWMAGIQRWISLGLGMALLAGLLTASRAPGFPGLGRAVTRLRGWMARYLRERSLRALAMLGLLNGLLPCGLVYAAGAGATSMGTWAGGIQFMAWFGLGTLPTMLGMSLTGRMVPIAVRRRLQRAAPVSIGLLAGMLILRGMGLGIPFLSPDLTGDSPCCPAPVASSHPRQ